MKKALRNILAVALVLVFTICLAACGTHNINGELNGTYVSRTHLKQLSFSFYDEESVTVNASIAGHTYYTQDGTFKVSENADKIVLTFSAAVASNMSYSGTYAFAMGEDYIAIDGVLYYLEDDNSSEQTDSSEEDAADEKDLLSGKSLSMPQAPYEIAYSITDESENGGVTFTQSITETSNGIALNFMSGKEKYLFEKLESGKYVMYVYDNITDAYVSSASNQVIQKLINQGIMANDTLAVNQSVVDGYVARISANYDCYKAFSSDLKAADAEEVNDIDCLKYTAPYKTISGTQNMSFWIDPQTGICTKAEYYYTSGLKGSTYARTIECTGISTENVSLPNQQ